MVLPVVPAGADQVREKGTVHICGQENWHELVEILTTLVVLTVVRRLAAHCGSARISQGMCGNARVQATIR